MLKQEFVENLWYSLWFVHKMNFSEKYFLLGIGLAGLFGDKFNVYLTVKILIL